ncbi:uncharacterized protein ATC70_001628 [Mucor velutinosus]|uniref:Uncharacterized protein n=1 Tax=Mucor velutinosus TaxID=708070 RepID=A0AAN7DNE1_9FUNG|nr:hypothetical protein ATC70_001628 [Mucor velutinosus]
MCIFDNVGERAKHTLSYAVKSTVEIDFLFEDTDFYIPATCAQVKELNQDLSHDVNIGKGSVHDIVLVDGSTHIPKVQVMFLDFFSVKEPASLPTVTRQLPLVPLSNLSSPLVTNLERSKVLTVCIKWLNDSQANDGGK